jgi:peptide-methionine (S)-S-oxide reductase
MNQQPDFKQATFAGGCFWCLEAAFKRFAGVERVISGYMGGSVSEPTYEQVCSGTTGHAESIRISYNPENISYSELLEIFFEIHDPTTLNRQGNDIGSQYRSAIFYHDEEQHQSAEAYKRQLESEHVWDKPIVTQIAPATTFWPAEDYHQEYFDNHPSQSYCRVVIAPKVAKLREVFKDKLKK